jgi:NADPH:quinone reductase
MSTMRAVVLDALGPPDALQIRDLPTSTSGPGQVFVSVGVFR